MRNTFKTLFNALKSKLYILSHFSVVWKDILNIRSKVETNMGGLPYVVEWLKYAQDITPDGGLSAGYSFSRGWLSSYPETTGYTIPTFLDYYHLTNEKEYLNRAIKMADWLISIQMENGAFPGSLISEPLKPIVFNTGQVLQGLTKIYKETQRSNYLESAKRAANWLLKIQDEDGAWRRFTYNNIPHVYHTRVVWPLLELYEIVQNENYFKSSIKNVEWALRNQETNGWFRNNAFDLKSDPYLHTIGYTIEGLIECAILSKNKNWLNSAMKPAETLLDKLRREGCLSATYNADWEATAGYRCLTGEAQITLCWLKLFQINGDKKYFNAARELNNNLKILQEINSGNKGIKGGLKGSHPIWGDYQPFMYPNWVAKFLADTLILEKRLTED